MPLTPEEISNRVDYHAPNQQAVSLHDRIRHITHEYMQEMNDLLPDSREKSLAFTHLEQSMFWSNAAIARNHDKI